MLFILLPVFSHLKPVKTLGEYTWYIMQWQLECSRMILQPSVFQASSGQTSVFATHHFPLIAEAESADLFGLWVLGISCRWSVMMIVGCWRSPAVARLPITTGLTYQQDVAEVRDVAGSKAQSLNLGQLPVCWLSGDKSPECRKGCIHTVGTVSFSSVGCVTLPPLTWQTTCGAW